MLKDGRVYAVERCPLSGVLLYSYLAVFEHAMKSINSLDNTGYMCIQLATCTHTSWHIVLQNLKEEELNTV